MGLATKIVRFIRGEPIYEPDDVGTEEQQMAAAIWPDAKVEDVVPLIYIENVECALSEEHMDVYAHVRNASKCRVMLDTIRLLGVRRRLGEVELVPGESSWLLLYVGKRQAKIDEGEAELRYKAKDKDSDEYKEEEYSAHYKFHGSPTNEGAAVITGFELQLPVHET